MVAYDALDDPAYQTRVALPVELVDQLPSYATRASVGVIAMGRSPENEASWLLLPQL